MHHKLVERYIELQALLLTPIAPHWADYIWQEVLKHVRHLHASNANHTPTNVPQPTTIQTALWPAVPLPSASLSAAREYVRATSSAITSAEASQLKKQAKGKTTSFDPKRAKKLTIFAASSYPAWQDRYIDLVREAFENTQLSTDKELVGRVAKMGETKKAMPFVQGLKKRLVQGGEKPETVFERKLAFSEEDTLAEMVPGLQRTTGCRAVEVVVIGADGVGTSQGKRVETLPQSAEQAVPGTPSFYFENVE